MSGKTRRKKSQEIITGYSGPFSSFPEWHSFGVGFYYGSNETYDRVPEKVFDEDSDMYNKDVDAEAHYAQAIGYPAGDFYRRNRRKIYAATGVTFSSIAAYLGGGF